MDEHYLRVRPVIVHLLRCCGLQRADALAVDALTSFVVQYVVFAGDMAARTDNPHAGLLTMLTRFGVRPADIETLHTRCLVPSVLPGDVAAVADAPLEHSVDARLRPPVPDLLFADAPR